MAYIDQLIQEDRVKDKIKELEKIPEEKIKIQSIICSEAAEFKKIKKECELKYWQLKTDFEKYEDLFIKLTDNSGNLAITHEKLVFEFMTYYNLSKGSAENKIQNLIEETTSILYLKNRETIKTYGYSRNLIRKDLEKLLERISFFNIEYY